MIKQTNWIYLVNSNNGDYIRYNLHLTPDNIQYGYMLFLVNNKAILNNEIINIHKIKLSEYQFNHIKGFIKIKPRNLSLRLSSNKYSQNILTVIPKDKTIVEVRNDLINEILKGKIC